VPCGHLEVRADTIIAYAVIVSALPASLAGWLLEQIGADFALLTHTVVSFREQCR
jgi:hypothetical protein